MNGGHHDVAGWLVPELDDALAQVSIDDLDAPIFERRVQPTLFRQHRFALDDPLDAPFHEEVGDDPVVLLGVTGPVDGCACAGRFLLESPPELGQARERVAFERGDFGPKGLPVRYEVGCSISIGTYEPEGLVVPGGSRFVGDEFASATNVPHRPPQTIQNPTSWPRGSRRRASA